MSSAKRRSKPIQPKANPPICWICDRKLYGGGKYYWIVQGLDDREHPAHVGCAKKLEQQTRTVLP